MRRALEVLAILLIAGLLLFAPDRRTESSGGDSIHSMDPVLDMPSVRGTLCLSWFGDSPGHR